MPCEPCGGPRACFEGKTYCPECCRYEAEGQAREADGEARRGLTGDEK
jgi:hypothetical protein